jgi:hypothetical protein
VKIDNVSMGLYDNSGNSWRFWAELPQFQRYFNNAFSTLRKCIRKEGQKWTQKSLKNGWKLMKGGIG